jgi:hypothetical protein
LRSCSTSGRSAPGRVRAPATSRADLARGRAPSLSAKMSTPRSAGAPVDRSPPTPRGAREASGRARCRQRAIAAAVTTKTTELGEAPTRGGGGSRRGARARAEERGCGAGAGDAVAWVPEATRCRPRSCCARSGGEAVSRRSALWTAMKEGPHLMTRSGCHQERAQRRPVFNVARRVGSQPKEDRRLSALRVGRTDQSARRAA